MTPNREHAEANFVTDIAAHQMTVLRDEGVYRHLSFGKPGSNDQRFDIVTWPGTLCFTGDMETYVFSRIEDMFEFFRSGRGINPCYWSEKLQATPRSGHEEFSEATVTQYVTEAFNDWCKENEGHKAIFEDLWQDIQSDVLDHLQDGQYAVVEALTEFHHPETDFTFDDPFEWNLTEYTHHFIWCCLAIAHAIEMYDKSKVEVPA